MTRPAFITALGLAIGLALGAILIREGMRSAPPAPSLSLEPWFSNFSASKASPTHW